MFYPRRVYPLVKRHLLLPEATVITGMRRTGKTFLLNKLFSDLSSDNKIMIDLENRINRELFQVSDYDEIWENIKRKYGLTSEQKPYLFLDEIQYAKQLPSIMKYLSDHYQIKFIVTGSSSFYLKNLFSESLSGRKQIFELFPLTFKEFLLFRQKVKKLPEEEWVLGGIKKSDWWQKMYQSALEEYLEFGGFPKVVLTENKEEKRNLLKDILYSYSDQDVRSLSNFKKISELENLIRLLSGRIGQKLDITKLSREIGLSRQTIQQYLSFLEKTYLIFLIKPFSRNIDREISKTAKIYFCDNGLANLLGRLSSGQMMENMVFHELRVKCQPKWAFSSINYYRRKSGVEIDFILNQETGLEVKETVSEFDQNRLAKFSSQLKLKEYYLVSKNLSRASHTFYASQL